jgi:transposase
MQICEERGQGMSKKRRRGVRQVIEVEQLKQDPASLLSWGVEDMVLNKLETYRLYREGYAVEDIAEAFGYTRPYMYEMWAGFERGGVEHFVDKRWGSAPRKRTTEGEAQVLRAKALNPQLSDADLAREFGMDRSTVYNLLDEHGMQDLHRVIAEMAEEQDSTPSSDEGEKGGSLSQNVNKPCC